jgi:hypothetical protein
MSKRRPAGYDWEVIHDDLHHCPRHNKYWKPSEQMARCAMSAQWAGWIGAGAQLKSILVESLITL